jgi:hypothetical protein
LVPVVLKLANVRKAFVQTDPRIPPEENNPPVGSAAPFPSESAPPMIGAPPLLASTTDPSIKPGPARNFVAFVLSLSLGFFLLDSVFSLLDDSLNLFFNLHLLSLMRGLVFFFAMLTAIVVYVLMGLTPMVPKRWFLPVTLFSPLVALAVIPLSIYHYSWIPWLAWVFSFCQVIAAIGLLLWVRGGLKIRWPLVTANQLESRGFSWRNLIAFVAVNLFVLLPAVAVYSLVCASLAVNHFSDGFMALRPGGFTVQVRKYIRDDGKTIQLFPMSHVADSDFYQKVSESFPRNSIVLMEGVTDRQNLLTNKISYKRMAATLGLSEQHEKFAPSQGETVRADVDVDQFSASTIGLLNLAMLLHSKGINPETLLALLSYPQPPGFERELLDDLITKRNQHLLGEIRARLPESEHIIVPWGAMHMPQLAREIQKSGFHLTETRDYMVIRFRSPKNAKQM